MNSEIDKDADSVQGSGHDQQGLQDGLEAERQPPLAKERLKVCRGN